MRLVKKVLKWFVAIRMDIASWAVQTVPTPIFCALDWVVVIAVSSALALGKMVK
jgi:hypothetical protein